MAAIVLSTNIQTFVQLYISGCWRISVIDVIGETKGRRLRNTRAVKTGKLYFVDNHALKRNGDFDAMSGNV